MSCKAQAAFQRWGQYGGEERGKKNNLKAKKANEMNTEQVLTRTDAGTAPQNTSVKCTGSPLPSCQGARYSCLGPGWALFVSQILKEQEAFSAPKTCRQTGGFEGPQLSSAQSFEANWKLRFMGLNESEGKGGKLEKKPRNTEDCCWFFSSSSCFLIVNVSAAWYVSSRVIQTLS